MNCFSLMATLFFLLSLQVRGRTFCFSYFLWFDVLFQVQKYLLLFLFHFLAPFPIAAWFLAWTLAQAGTSRYGFPSKASVAFIRCQYQLIELSNLCLLAGCRANLLDLTSPRNRRSGIGTIWNPLPFGTLLFPSLAIGTLICFVSFPLLPTMLDHCLFLFFRRLR